MGLDLSPVWAGWTNILRNALVTVEVTAAALMFDCILGLLIGIGRLNPRRRFIYGICTACATLIHSTPLLAQLLLLFFGLPQLDILLPAFVCGVLGLGAYLGAYVLEIVRGTIQSADHGQMEAAWLTGTSSAQPIHATVLPQAVVRMIPLLGSELIALIENSALVSLLMIHDLIHERQKIINTSYYLLEVYLAIALVYLVLTSTASYLLHRLECSIHTGSMVQ